MKPDVEQILSEVYELEGLLTLASNRGEETPRQVYMMIKEKADRIHSIINYRIEIAEHADDNEAIGVTGFDMFETVSELEPAALEGSNRMEPAAPAASAASMSLGEEEEGVAFIMETDAPAETPEPPTEEAPVAEEPKTPEEREEPEEQEEPETLRDEIDVEEAEIYDEPIRLDEALQRSLSKDLRTAFSLNDTFRFRRELFGNNAADMTDAIYLVEAMHSYAEAEDYFYNDLCWDQDSEEVKEFMQKIKNHFS